MEIEKLTKIADVLGRNLFEGMNINSVSRESGVSIASVYRILKRMEKKNEVLKEKTGNNIFYRLNLKNSFARKYVEMASIKRRERFFMEKPEYYDLLTDLKNSMKPFSVMVGIFGSLARLEKKPADIDMLVIYKSDIKPIQEIIRKRDSVISPFYLTPDELKKKAKAEVMANIISDLVILEGEAEFWSILSEVT